MDRQYKYFRKQLGSERREITIEELRGIIRVRFPDSVETAISYMKCGEKITVSGVLLVAEAVA